MCVTVYVPEDTHTSYLIILVTYINASLSLVLFVRLYSLFVHVNYSDVCMLYCFCLQFSVYELFIMVALCNRADHYILPCGFYLLSFFPRLISAVGDWMSTILPHMVWL